MEELKLEKIPEKINLNGNIFHNAIGISWEDMDKFVNEQGNCAGLIVFVDDEIYKKIIGNS
jgi:hypothetical protein